MQEAEKAGCSKGSCCVVPSFPNFKPNAFPHPKFKGLVYVCEKKLSSTCRLVTKENLEAAKQTDMVSISFWGAQSM